MQQQISDALRREEEAEAQQAQRQQQGNSSAGAPAPDSFEGIMARIEHGDEGRGGVELPLSDKIEKFEKFHLFAIPDDDEDEDGDEDDVQAGAQDLNDLRFGAMSLHRAPAQIEWHGRDSFTIRASPAEALAAAADAAAAAAGGPQAQPAAWREEDPAAAAAVAVAERLAIGGEATDLRQVRRCAGASLAAACQMSACGAPRSVEGVSVLQCASVWCTAAASCDVQGMVCVRCGQLRPAAGRSAPWQRSN